MQHRTGKNISSSPTLKAQNEQDAQSQQGLALHLLVSLVVVVFGLVFFGGGGGSCSFVEF